MGIFKFFVGVFVCVCVFAGDRDCRSRDRFQRVCVRRVRASRAHRIRKVQIDTLFALLVVVYRILIFRGWDVSFAQLIESTGDVLIFLRAMGIVFLFNNR